MKNIKKIFLCLSILFFATNLFSASNSLIYGLESAVFYFEHKSDDFKLQLNAWHDSKNTLNSTVTPALLATIYSPTGKALKDFYWYDEHNDGKFNFEFTEKNAEKGFWELRITISRACGIKYQFITSSNEEYAVMPSRCSIRYNDSLNFRKVFFKVAENQKQDLDILGHNTRLIIKNLHGQEKLSLENSKTTLTLQPSEIYELQVIPSSPNWNWWSIGKLPLFLCPNPEFAQRLSDAKKNIFDDKLLSFAFQKRFLEWRSQLTVDDLEIEKFDLSEYRDEFLKEPESLILLDKLGPLACAEFLLKSQNIDLLDQEFGYAPHNLGALAYLYALDRSYNPYYKNKALLNRLSLAALYDLCVGKRSLFANGTIQNIALNYSGLDCMLMVPEGLMFYFLSEDLDEDLFMLWSDALGYPLRRFFNVRESCENQTLHQPVKLWLYAKATKNELFEKLAENFIVDINNLQRNTFLKTGYLQESYGPDATYQGLSNSMLAFYSHFSNDENALKLLDKLFVFFNHTVAPEPNGNFFGSSGFSHRTMGGWYIGQYGKGSRLAAAKLKSAACWHQQGDKQIAVNELDKMLKWVAKDAESYYKQFPQFAQYSFSSFSPIWPRLENKGILAEAMLPVEDEKFFNRSFGTEFLFIRRPAYYSTHYFGKTAGKHVHFRNNLPQHQGWTENNGIWSTKDRKIFMPLQGPQMFWTESCGTVLVSMNWTLFTHWTVRLQDTLENYDWIDYWGTEVEYLNESNCLIYKQQFRESECKLERKIEFLENGIKTEITLDKLPKGMIAVEQFPGIVKKELTIEFGDGETWSKKPLETIKMIRWTNQANKGVLLLFSEEVSIEIGRTFRDQGQTINSMNVILPKSGKLKYILTEI